MRLGQADGGGAVGGMNDGRAQLLFFQGAQDLLETLKLPARVLLVAGIGCGEMGINALVFQSWQGSYCLDQSDHFRHLFSSYTQPSHAAINFDMHLDGFPQSKRGSRETLSSFKRVECNGHSQANRLAHLPERDVAKNENRGCNTSLAQRRGLAYRRDS